MVKPNKKSPPRKLDDLQVDEVSLVDNPANEEPFLLMKRKEDAVEVKEQEAKEQAAEQEAEKLKKAEADKLAKEAEEEKPKDVNAAREELEGLLKTEGLSDDAKAGIQKAIVELAKDDPTHLSHYVTKEQHEKFAIGTAETISALNDRLKELEGKGE